MPTHSALRTLQESGYRPPKKYVLVLSCVDARLLDDLVQFLDQDNLTNRYYHVTLPGTALGLTDRVREDTCDAGLLEQFARWRLTFIDQVRAALILTQGMLTDIYVVQHEDCGAFRVYLDKDSDKMRCDQEKEMHWDYACALYEDINTNFDAVYNRTDRDGNGVQKKKPFVHLFYMDLRGNVEHLACTTKGAKNVKSDEVAARGKSKKKRNK